MLLLCCQARKYERPGLKQDEIEEIKEAGTECFKYRLRFGSFPCKAFDLFDTDQSGEIDLKELKA